MKKVDNRPHNSDNSMWTLSGIAVLLIAVMIIWNFVTI